MNATKKGDSYFVDVGDEEADAIRDACGEHLQRVGFDADYNPTLEGEMLEKLIDLFLVQRTE